MRPLVYSFRSIGLSKDNLPSKALWSLGACAFIGSILLLTADAARYAILMFPGLIVANSLFSLSKACREGGTINAHFPALLGLIVSLAGGAVLFGMLAQGLVLPPGPVIAISFSVAAVMLVYGVLQHPSKYRPTRARLEMIGFFFLLGLAMFGPVALVLLLAR